MTVLSHGHSTLAAMPDTPLPERREELRSLGGWQELFRTVWPGTAWPWSSSKFADGRPYPREINGRFWGSRQLAIDAEWTSLGFSTNWLQADLWLWMRHRTQIPLADARFRQTL